MIKTKDDNNKNYNFTPREFDIMHLLTYGMINGEIAKTLFISLSTVKANLTNIYTKLGVKNRTEATRKIIDEDILTHRPDSEQP